MFSHRYGHLYTTDVTFLTYDEGRSVKVWNRSEGSWTQVSGNVFQEDSSTWTPAPFNVVYQWNRNGQPIAGATGATLVITDANGTLHDGNYTLTATNDFGSVTSPPPTPPSR